MGGDVVEVREVGVVDIPHLRFLANELTQASEWGVYDWPVLQQTARVLIASSAGCALMATIKGAPVGVVAGIAAADPYRGILTLQEFFWVVHRDHRKQGVGEALIDEFEEWGKRHSCKRVIVSALSDAPGRLAELFLANGYEHLETNYAKAIG
jgi:GNAT superfamily N-acetyltransferase